MRFKQYFILLFFLSVSAITFAQSKKEKIKDNLIAYEIFCDSLYNSVCFSNDSIFGERPEQFPRFPGDEKKLAEFLFNNTEFPKECVGTNIQGRVVVCFIVSETGKVLCPIIVNSVHPALDKEAIRVVAKMPDWYPAENEGKPVSCSIIFPFVFKTNLINKF